MADRINFPTPGCIVEYLEDNAPQIAMVLEEISGKLRLLSPGRRESKLSANRLLPWIGPAYPANLTRDDAIRALENHKRSRQELTGEINPVEVWELAQGEISQAPAAWFAELFENDPSPDAIAAFGRALLGCKSHFRFQPPEFQVYDAETVEKRLTEQHAREQREALTAGGASFLRLLWEIATKKRAGPPNSDFSGLLPPPEAATRIESLLRQRMIQPDSQDDEHLWQIISKGLPDVPHLPLQLLAAWGKLPIWHNFWLDRAAYDPSDAWWHDDSNAVNALAQIGRCESGILPKPIDLPFISIDGPTTTDIDDAFHIVRTENGWKLTIALACPALDWPFGQALDQKVAHRATSIYLPEGDLHMLPSMLGEDAFSLWANKSRPALCVEMEISESGEYQSVKPYLATVKLAANLRYSDVQEVLDCVKNQDPLPENSATPFLEKLLLANECALIREALRVSKGAVIMLRPEQQITLQDKEGEILANLEVEPPKTDASRIVAEMMVLTSSALADWAYERNLPLIHRTQNITLSPDSAGIWSDPVDLSTIVRQLMPSILEIIPKPHAALASARYAPATSPLRRYADLVNEAQIIAWLQTGKPRWEADALERLLTSFSPALDAASQVQKMRPRFWKLLYFRQQGDKYWWNGIVTEENDSYVTVTLHNQGLFVRGKRELFDERTGPGSKVKIRIGKVNPLYNEIHILEALPDE